MGIRRLNILLIDCDPKAADVVKLVALYEKHSIDIVATAQEGFKLIVKISYDLIFYAVNPNDTDTVNFLTKIKPICPYTKCIPVYPKPKDMACEAAIAAQSQQAIKDGAIGTITKPYFVDSIKYWINVVADIIMFIIPLGDTISDIVKRLHRKEGKDDE